MAVGLERTQGPSVSARRTEDGLGLFPVHPLTVAQDRAVLPPSRAKDAPTDAALQRARLLTHRAQRSPQSPTMRALAPRVADRRRLVGDTVRLPNRVPRALTHSCPHVLPGFQEQDPVLFGDGLSRWPPRKAVQRARRATWAGVFRAHPVRSAAGLATRIQAITSARALTTDAGVLPCSPTRLLAGPGFPSVPAFCWQST